MPSIQHNSSPHLWEVVPLYRTSYCTLLMRNLWKQERGRNMSVTSETFAALLPSIGGKLCQQAHVCDSNTDSIVVAVFELTASQYRPQNSIQTNFPFSINWILRKRISIFVIFIQKWPIESVYAESNSCYPIYFSYFFRLCCQIYFSLILWEYYLYSDNLLRFRRKTIISFGLQ